MVQKAAEASRDSPTSPNSSSGTTAAVDPHAAFQTVPGLSTHHQPSSYRQIIDEAG